jgi:phytoene synthase
LPLSEPEEPAVPVAPESPSPAGLSYCGQEVRRHDHDRFLTTLFAPAERREALWALYAFNLEIARTRELVTEPLLGQIRLQWWRETVEALFEPRPGQAPASHEVVRPLAAAIERHRLSRAPFERLLEAREADLEPEGPATLAALTAYAEATGAPLVELALEILEVREPAAGEVGRAVGTAWALTGLLRAVPFHAHGQRVTLPADRMAAHGLTVNRLFQHRPEPEALRAVVREVAAAAAGHLELARRQRAQMPAAALPALLPAALADLHLATLRRAGWDVFAPRVQLAHPLRPLRLAWRALIGRY